MGLRDTAGPRLAVSVIVGIVLIPLSAVAAVMLSDKGADTTATTLTTVGASADGTTAAQDISASTEDLAYACGEGGLWLVELERDGSITDLQQSALDALRGICSSTGSPLPGKDAPDPIVHTEVITVSNSDGGPTTPTSMPSSTTSTFDDHGDDEDEHEVEYEDHEDDDDHGDHHEHEDEVEHEHETEDD
jgi:hypothetical protein